ncbi:DUF3515 domain-containing protein [Nocardioides daphniae]|uniref:DUF3515 domain-containing protein n=1 Tax=Nocardioides daphniae TaxID=402297 RepID=A0A4P7UD97_9ACTN|nr:DUF3515 domain-containing protein [Nocardioides daphniae]QCC76889.1 DUF3515 domain-containing protein [Nocardioides daphniae]GGD17428.1 hypothetical protein GCM10007231_15550 [Nocardioides daphniae]
MTARPRRTAALLLPALAPALALLLGGCSSTVEIASEPMDDAERAACEALVADLPDELFEQERVEVSGGVGAAWGDDPVVLTCGAPQPEEYDPFARCSEIDGVGWFIPGAQMKDPDSDIEMTVLSHAPRVRLDLPAEHRFKGPDTHLRTLAVPIKEHLDEVMPCT